MDNPKTPNNKMETKTYQTIIEELNNPNLDAKSVVVYLAKYYPDIFLKCVTKEADVTEREKALVIPLIGASKTIEAIKTLREHRRTYGGNDALLNCKDTVEKWRAEAGIE